MVTKILSIGFLILFFIDCGGKNLMHNIESKLPIVEIRLKYDNDIDNIPTEILLDGDEELYYKKINERQFTYSFLNVKPGKYGIGLAFDENYKGKSIKKIYGLEEWNVESINVDEKGNVTSERKPTRSSEIEVLRDRLIMVELVISTEIVDIEYPDYPYVYFIRPFLVMEKGHLNIRVIRRVPLKLNRK